MDTEPYSEPLIFLYLSFQSYTTGILLYLALFIVLLLISAFVSGSKIAFCSLTSEISQNLNETKGSKNKTIARLIENPAKLSLTLFFASILVNSAIIVIWFFFFDIYLKSPLLSPSLAIFIKLCSIIFILVIFCEIIPRIIASLLPYQFSKFSARLIFILAIILWPLSKLFGWLSHYIEYHLIKKKSELSITDLSNAIEISEQTTKEDKKILEGIASYGSIYTVEIMRPRIDVVAFDISLAFDRVLDKINNHKHSRIPIYLGTFDNIKGILYVKDLLPHFHKKTFNWQSLIRPAYFVPESKKINDLLADFQKKKIHMAVVIDEYGGTSGIITLEDVLEEIVGEIVYEADPSNEFYKKIDENNYVFEGKTSLNDFFKIIQIDDDYFEEVQGDADTLAGVILEMNGEIPKPGTSFPYKEFAFTVISSDKRRIKQIKVTKNIF